MEYEKSDNGQNVYRWEDGDNEFVKAHTKFVKRYMPELYTFDVKNYMGSNFNESPNFGVHPYMLHLGNNFIEENNNVELLQKQAELEVELLQKQTQLQDEKDAIDCKESSLRGSEYIAKCPILSNLTMGILLLIHLCFYVNYTDSRVQASDF